MWTDPRDEIQLPGTSRDKFQRASEGVEYKMLKGGSCAWRQGWTERRLGGDSAQARLVTYKPPGRSLKVMCWYSRCRQVFPWTAVNSCFWTSDRAAIESARSSPAICAAQCLRTANLEHRWDRENARRGTRKLGAARFYSKWNSFLIMCFLDVSPFKKSLEQLEFSPRFFIHTENPPPPNCLATFDLSL